MSKGKSSGPGKGDRPRNNYSQQFRTRYDEIDWGRKKPKPKKP